MDSPRYVDLGGAGELLHLAPANGFPPETYRPLARALAPGLRTVGYRPRPLWPGARPEEMASWRDLAADMLADLGRALPGQRLIGVGHSLGGVMTLYAGVAAPERFRGLALLDPVIQPRHLMPVIWVARRSGQIARHPLVQGATRRRDRFASREEARQRLSGRGAFAGFVPEALEAYLEAGLVPDGDGQLTLAWPKQWEATIFAAQPLDTWDALARLRLPLLLVRGTRSDLVVDGTWRDLRRRLPHATMVEVDAGHMLPLQQPAAVADLIRSWVAGLPAA